MRKLTTSVLGTALGLMLIGSVPAQQTTQERPQRNQTQDRKEQQPAKQDKQACMASKLMDMTVKSKQGECGKLKDLIIGSDGSVKYLVIAAKGSGHDSSDRSTTTKPQDANNRATAGSDQMGDLIVVPWQLAKFEEGKGSSGKTSQNTPGHTGSTQSASVMLDIEKSRLEQAPKFSKSDLEQWAQKGESKIAKVDQFFGSEHKAARPDLNRSSDRGDKDRSKNDN